MIYEIMRHIRNFFPDREKQKVAEFTISNNVIAPSVDIATNQYFLIEGSTFNDGVYKKTADLSLDNESFSGVITPLKIPKDFLSLVAEIEEYQSRNVITPYRSESFGGYSYEIASNGNGKRVTWQDSFATRLNAWRKI